MSSQPLKLFRGRREKVGFHKQPHSHSGNLIRRSKKDSRGRYSALASTWTSPTNSGLILAIAALPPSNDSTMEHWRTQVKTIQYNLHPLPPGPGSATAMEELQAAIQAAIAHCKNSIAKEAKC